MIRLGYHLLFFAFFWLSAPFYFLNMWRRGGWRPGFWQRFGFYDDTVRRKLAEGPVIWLHAVSVGEAGVCAQLVKALAPRLAGWKLVVSTTTSTGMAELRRLLPPEVTAVYYPADFYGAVRRARRALRPRAIVLVEAELWPNFLWQALDAGQPLFLVNARVSENSRRNYLRFGFLFRPIFARFSGVGCQQPGDAGRMATLGFSPGAVQTTGSLKFDAAQTGPAAGTDVPALLRQAGVPGDALILVAGSTHAGEEALLVEMAARLRTRFPRMFLILVPRHVERTRQVTADLEARKVKYILRTELAGGGAAPAGLECLVVNSTGELKAFYQAAAVVFVGKSLTAQGGQNPIEPAALGKAVVFGPHMQNFRAAARAFVENHAAIQAPDAAGVEQALAELLADAPRRQALGDRARDVVRRSSGATGRTVELILAGLPTINQI